MKKMTLAVCLFVQALGSVSALAVPLKNVHNIQGGMVRSVSWADSTKGTMSEIVVRNALGKNVNILITATTTLWDADAKPIDKIMTRSHVNVIYLTTPEGVNVAKSIRVLK